MEPKKIDELDVARLQVLDLKGRLAAKDASDAMAAANDLRASYVAEFNRLCASVGADPAVAQIDYETGEVKVS